MSGQEGKRARVREGDRRNRMHHALVALASISLVWLDPFGFSRWTEYAKEDLYFQIAAFGYPEQQARIGVVLADDSTLASAREGRQIPAAWSSWPLPLSAWAEAVGTDADRGAKVIFST